MKTLILGTRSSPMAQAVAYRAKHMIEQSHFGMNVEVHPFASQGDKFQGDLKLLGGKGAFIKDLERRLLQCEIDCAIHALKDIPGDVEPHPDLMLCTYLQRSDPRDVLIMRSGRSITNNDGSGLVLGTSSPRRQAQLRRLYHGIKVVPLRGNVNTRMAKLDAGEFDGIVLSLAGLDYLQAKDRISKVYEPEEMLPAIGQGVLCLQIRREDYERCAHLQVLNSLSTQMAITAEREVLKTLQGNCHSAIAGYCNVGVNLLNMRAMVFSSDGQQVFDSQSQQSLQEPAANLGRTLGNELLAAGAKVIMQSV